MRSAVAFGSDASEAGLNWFLGSLAVSGLDSGLSGGSGAFSELSGSILKRFLALWRFLGSLAVLAAVLWLDSEAVSGSILRRFLALWRFLGSLAVLAASELDSGLLAASGLNCVLVAGSGLDSQRFCRISCDLQRCPLILHVFPCEIEFTEFT